jgi:predicted RNase H-like nuclease (RuvC/YqgF family)
MAETGSFFHRIRCEFREKVQFAQERPDSSTGPLDTMAIDSARDDRSAAMAKGKPQKKKAVRVRELAPSASRSRANGQTIARLKAENRHLRASLRKVEKERDTYLRAVYAWIEEEVSKQDLNVLMDLKNAVPFAQVIEEMKQELRR